MCNKFESSPQCRKGKIGEDIVCRELHSDGYTVEKPADTAPSGASLVDFVVEGNYERFFAEVKVRTPFPYCYGRFPVYTFPASLIEAYEEYSKKNGTPLALYVVDGERKLVCRQFLNNLAQPKRVENKIFPLSIEQTNGNYRYYHISQFEPVCQIAPEDLEELAAVKIPREDDLLAVDDADETYISSELDDFLAERNCLLCQGETELQALEKEFGTLPVINAIKLLTGEDGEENSKLNLLRYALSNEASDEERATVINAIRQELESARTPQEPRDDVFDLTPDTNPRVEKVIKTPHGVDVDILAYDGGFFVKLSRINQAVGFASGFKENGTLTAAAKQAGIELLDLQCPVISGTKGRFIQKCVPLFTVPRLLDTFVKLTSTAAPKTKKAARNAKAKELFIWFSRVANSFYEGKPLIDTPVVAEPAKEKAVPVAEPAKEKAVAVPIASIGRVQADKVPFNLLEPVLPSQCIINPASGEIFTEDGIQTVPTETAPVTITAQSEEEPLKVLVNKIADKLALPAAVIGATLRELKMQRDPALKELMAI